MVRKLLCVMALTSLLGVAPGCGGGGGDGTFTESAAQTPEEVQEAQDYEEMLRKQEQENFKKK